MRSLILTAALLCALAQPSLADGVNVTTRLLAPVVMGQPRQDTGVADLSAAESICDQHRTLITDPTVKTPTWQVGYEGCSAVGARWQAFVASQVQSVPPGTDQQNAALINQAVK